MRCSDCGGIGATFCPHCDGTGLWSDSSDSANLHERKWRRGQIVVRGVMNGANPSAPCVMAEVLLLAQNFEVARNALENILESRSKGESHDHETCRPEILTGVHCGVQRVCQKFSEKELEDIWTNEWNALIIGHAKVAREPLTESVWEKTARNLGLRQPSGQPLRLDAVFCEDKKYDNIQYFPILVALEHEYVSSNFWEEIVKLLIRPVSAKGGNDLLCQGRDHTQKLAEMEHTIRKYFEKCRSVVDEDPGTEYLFLAGTVQRSPFRIEWSEFHFSSHEIPQQSQFQKV